MHPFAAEDEVEIFREGNPGTFQQKVAYFFQNLRKMTLDGESDKHDLQHIVP